MCELLGYVGGFAFAICALPQAWRAYRDGHSRGLAPWFLSLWLGGEVCMIAATWLAFGFCGWLQLNYWPNLICVCILVRFKIWPR